MSMSEGVVAPCPSCGKSVRLEVYFSINGARRTDLRAAILNDSLGRSTCSSCGAALRAPPRLSYVDPRRGEWILVEPASELGEWADLEAAAQDIFDRTYGPAAPPVARTIGRSLRPRVTFGWAALREKLLCSQLGLDDVAVEIVKTMILRAGGEILFADDAELRLVAADDKNLTFLWLNPTSGAPIEELQVTRSLLTDTAGPAFDALRDLLTLGSFVDVHRVLVVSTPEV